MRRTLAILAAVALVSTAWADWDTGDPAKWVQNPDLNPTAVPTGMDVRCGPNIRWDNLTKTLADDFLCTEAGPITSVHIWASWLDDVLPIPAPGGPGDPGAVDFRLSLHRDIPAIESSTGYSMPAPDPIWEGLFPAGTFTVRRFATADEDFYDPNHDLGDPAPPYNGIIGKDTICWQYNFDLAVAGTNPPKQEGTAANPIVYWLDVTAFPHDDNAVFGWKTSLDHWNDDAVYWDDTAAAIPKELRYPVGHPFAGESIDLAFVLVPEPVTTGLLIVGAAGLLLRRRRR